jgi:hypothetical protein
VHPRPEPVVGASGGDTATQVGVYRRAASTMEIADSKENAAGLRLTVTDTSDLADVIGEPAKVVELLPVAEDVYVGRLPGSHEWTPAVFFALADGSRYVHLGARATQRLEG